MAKLDIYREYIQRLLKEYAARDLGEDNVDVQLIFDTEHDHYQLFYVGWRNRRRVYGPVIHLDIKNEKIWLQWNGTEDDIAADLVELGVPKQDIVLGFHSPYMRQFTDYAVG
ncbi:XisI protein [Nostoc sp. FACHB-87]|uniref:XisI protein n=1 Tax=Nostocales TaxID=1161 RepID=UPI001682894E|nr:MULTISPECIES: XisI protein [Nostocales]MBD2300801.1 XisI protein [Nostoc sp. FACHB-190]MBD2455293.1 XisI protein [Nostoc sp. FACHB-87]MBD2476882.1 XisI protein [Anabaena sp. FACHB-83]MBD2489213.1 XisI protein [Aulosira sp. FACHB-615]